MRPLLPLLALVAVWSAPSQAQDATQGKAVFARCQICHVAAKGAKPTIGPNLFGVVGRKAGSTAGFAYSPAMKAAGFDWSPQKLDAYLKAPAKVVPGNRMPFSGLPDAMDRDAVIAYLKTLH